MLFQIVQRMTSKRTLDLISTVYFANVHILKLSHFKMKTFLRVLNYKFFLLLVWNDPLVIIDKRLEVLTLIEKDHWQSLNPDK